MTLNEKAELILNDIKKFTLKAIARLGEMNGPRCYKRDAKIGSWRRNAT